MEASYLRGPQPLYQRHQVKRGILGFQAFHPNLQALPLCNKSSGQRLGSRAHQRVLGKKQYLGDLVTYLYSNTWTEHVELFSLVLASVIRTSYKETCSVISVQQWNHLFHGVMSSPSLEEFNTRLDRETLGTSSKDQGTRSGTSFPVPPFCDYSIASQSFNIHPF